MNCSTHFIDLSAQTFNFRLNTDGKHSATLWNLQKNPATGALQAVDMTGWTARLLAYSEPALTNEILNLTTPSNGLALVTVASKVFYVDDVPVTIANPWGVALNLSDANAASVAANSNRLYYHLFLTDAGNSEKPMFAKGELTVKGFTNA